MYFIWRRNHFCGTVQIRALQDQPCTLCMPPWNHTISDAYDNIQQIIGFTFLEWLSKGFPSGWIHGLAPTEEISLAKHPTSTAFTIIYTRISYVIPLGELLLPTWMLFSVAHQSKSNEAKSSLAICRHLWHPEPQMGLFTLISNQNSASLLWLPREGSNWMQPCLCSTRIQNGLRYKGFPQVPHVRIPCLALPWAGG
jgi:hypothetical protein